MKLILTLILFSHFGFAGQHGSGGNICVGNEETHFKAFDEIKFPELAASIHHKGTPLLRGPRVINSYFPMQEADILTSKSGARALLKLKAIGLFDPHLADMFEAYFLMIKDTFAMPQAFSVSAEVGMGSEELCRPETLKAVIITRNTGAIVVSMPLWNQLSVETQEVILIHETLRIAQLFTSWFKISNDELEKLTMLLYSEKLETFMSHEFYQMFKAHTEALMKQDRFFHLSVISRKDYQYQHYIMGSLHVMLNELMALQLEAIEHELMLSKKDQRPWIKHELMLLKQLKKAPRYIEEMSLDLRNEFGRYGP